MHAVSRLAVLVALFPVGACSLPALTLGQACKVDADCPIDLACRAIGEGDRRICASPPADEGEGEGEGAVACNDGDVVVDNGVRGAAIAVGADDVTGTAYALVATNDDAAGHTLTLHVVTAAGDDSAHDVATDATVGLFPTSIAVDHERGDVVLVYVRSVHLSPDDDDHVAVAITDLDGAPVAGPELLPTSSFTFVNNAFAVPSAAGYTVLFSVSDDDGGTGAFHADGVHVVDVDRAARGQNDRTALAAAAIDGAPIADPAGGSLYTARIGTTTEPVLHVRRVDDAGVEALVTDIDVPGDVGESHLVGDPAGTLVVWRDQADSTMKVCALSSCTPAVLVPDFIVADAVISAGPGQVGLLFVTSANATRFEIWSLTDGLVTGATLNPGADSSEKSGVVAAGAFVAGFTTGAGFDGGGDAISDAHVTRTCLP